MRLKFIKPNTLKGLLIYASIALALLFLLAFMVFNKIIPMVTNKGETVTVPDLKGMSIDDAINFVREKQLAVEVTDSSYNSELPPKTVLEQYPQPNAKVKINRRINLTLNAKNPPTVGYPDLTGSTFEFAQKQLKSLGLKIGNVQHRPDIAHNAILESTINGQRINPGERVSKGSTIDLVIGNHTDSFALPDFTDMQFDEAERYIVGMGLNIKAIHYLKDRTGQPNTVQKQLPLPGDTLRPGDMVEVWIIKRDQ